MIRLRTFGGLALTSPAGDHPLQPRRLALLAVLDAAGEVGVSRDILLGYLWPENEPESGRNALSQALHTIRRDLHAPDLIMGTSRLVLNRQVITSDRDDFLASLEQKDLEKAVGLYGGLYLDGFYVRNGRDFERWVEQERAGLLRRYRTSLESLAKAAEARADRPAAARWWQKLAESDRLDARAVAGSARSLLDMGDRSAALRLLEDYTRRLREELGTNPDQAIMALATSLRHEKPSDLPFGADMQAVAPDDSLPTPMVAGDRFTLAKARRREHGAALSMSAVLLIVTALGWYAARARSEVEGDAAVIAVMPFVIQGAGDQGYLGPGLQDLLSRNFAGLTGLRSIAPRAVVAALEDSQPPRDPVPAQAIARQLRAGSVLIGDIVPSGDRLRITATLFTAGRTSPLVEATVEGRTDSLFALADRLTTTLLAALRPGTSPRLTQSAAATTTSLPAFKAYLEADDFLRERRYHEAVASLEKAVTLDSTFALAWFRLSDAADWAGRPPLVATAARRAVELSSRLSERDRLLVAGFAAWQRGASAEAESMLRELLRGHPDDVEAWYFLGEVLFHNNPLQGRSMTEAREPFQRVVALEPLNGSAWSHLERVIALERKWDELEPIYVHLLDLKQFEPNPWSEALRDDVAGRTADWEAGLVHLRTWDDQMISAVISRLAVYFARVPQAEMVSRILTEAGRGPTTRAYAHMTLAELALAQGRIRESRAHLADAAQLDPPRALEYKALLVFTPFLPLDTSEVMTLIQALREPLARRVPSIFFTSQDSVASFLHAYLAALLEIRLGDASGIEGARASISTVSDPEARAQATALLQSLEAAAAWQRGQHDSVLAALEKVQLETQLQTLKLPFGSRSWERFLRAEALHQTGRDEAAIGWYQSLSENTTYDLIFAAPADLQLARIFRNRGDHRQARERYQRFLAAWRNCDPELGPMVETARRELAALR